MSRPAMLHHPVRFHISLEKRTFLKLQKLAKEKAKSLTQIFRDLAESLAEGRVVLREKSFAAAVNDIHQFREQGPVYKTRSEDIVREIRDSSE